MGSGCGGDLGGGDCAVEGLGIDGVAAVDGEMVELVGAVELCGAGGGAAPSGDGCGDDGAAGLINGDYVGAEDAGYVGRG